MKLPFCPIPWDNKWMYCNIIFTLYQYITTLKYNIINGSWPEWKGLWSLKQEVSVSSPCGCSKLSWERSPLWRPTVSRKISSVSDRIYKSIQQQCLKSMLQIQIAVSQINDPNQCFKYSCPRASSAVILFSGSKQRSL